MKLQQVLVVTTFVLLYIIGLVAGQDCPCSKEIAAACRQPWDGPDFDNDRNWEFAGMVEWMNEEEVAKLSADPPEPDQPRELPPYDPEHERAVAVSPEGKMYIWRGPLPGQRDDDRSGEDSHPGSTISPFLPGSPTLPTEGRSCFSVSELPEGRTRQEGNGFTLYTPSEGFTVESAAYTPSVGGTPIPFPAGGVEVTGGVMKIHHAVSFKPIEPMTRAIVVTGLSAIDDLVVNMQLITSTAGVQSELYVGNFPATFDLASGYEVRVLDSFAQSFAFISHEGFISSLLLGHVQISGTVCSYDSVPESWYDFPLAGHERVSTNKVGRTVLGDDTRKRDDPTTGFPYQAWGAIHSPTGDRHYCSGTKIGPRHFLTAGHCMFSKKSLLEAGKWVENARVWFGQNGEGTGLPPTASQAPFGIAKHSYYYTTLGWVWFGDWRYDYGMIVLKDKASTADIGWFGWSSKDFRSEVGRKIHLHGHPGFKYACAASPRADKKCGGYMYGDSGHVWDRSDYHIKYVIDTNKGNSGSGVYDYNGGNRMLVGVHAYGDNGDGYNKAVRIRNEVFDNLKDWRSQWPSQYD